MSWGMIQDNAMAATSGLGVVRLGVDMTTGHGCFPPTRAITASMTVYTDQIANVRVSDQYAAHCCPQKGCHTPVASGGSRTVFSDMLMKQRSTDAMGCGDHCRASSVTTYAGI